MQNANKWHQPCRKCSAGVGRPCEDRYGRVAEKVHYGRGEYVRSRGATRRRSPVRVPYRRTEAYRDAYAEIEGRRFRD